MATIMGSGLELQRMHPAPLGGEGSACVWALLFPRTAPPGFICHQAAAGGTLWVLWHPADLGLAGHMATETWPPCSD